MLHQKSIFKLFVIGFLLLVSSRNVFSQTNPIRTDLIPASPNAGSVAKVNDVPVNLSAGLPNLNIPIFTVKGQDLSLPISINYSYDGFKPANTSGFVGLGWSLEAGGVITRSIKDKVDGTMGSGNYDGATVQAAINNQTSQDQQFLYNAAQHYDLQPDVYNFSFLGYSGKFIQFKGKFYIFPNQQLKIVGSASAFIITTENGTKYTFDALETTNPKGNSGAPYNLPSSYTSAWYLTKIENASGTESIRLEYTSEGTIANYGAVTQSYRKDINIPHDTAPNAPTVSFPTYVNPLRISAIKSELHTVNFYTGELRQDLNQTAGGASRVLDRIEIIGRGNVQKNFKFYASYFGQGYNKYLRLDSLQELAHLSSNIKPLVHKFEYNPLDAVSRVNAAVDHFGFYTGSGEFDGMVLPSIYHPNGANRTPNFAGASQGALTKVTYPTSGSIDFSYELNRHGGTYVNNPGSATIDLVRQPGGNGTTAMSNSFQVTTQRQVHVFLTRTPYNPYSDGIARNIDDDFILSGASGPVLSGKIGLESENAGKSYYVNLAPGNYVLQAFADLRENRIGVNVHFVNQTNGFTIGDPGAGIRLSKMVKDPNSGHKLTTLYEYKYPNGYSSGILPINAYDQKPFRVYTSKPSEIEEKHYNIISSYISEGPFTGLPHAYNSVVEKQVKGLDTLVVRHDFTIFASSSVGNAEIRTTSYKKNGMGKFVPDQVKHMEYEVIQDTLFRSMKPYQTMEVLLEGGYWTGPLYEYSWTDDFTSLGWKRLKKSSVVTYLNGDSVISETSNKYDRFKNLVLTETNSSDGTRTKTRTKYPQSYTSGFSNLLTAHVLSPVVEQQVWRMVALDSSLVAGSLTEYHPTLFKPSKVYALEQPHLNVLNNESVSDGLYNHFLSDTRYQEKADFFYNAAGRLLTQIPKYGAPISYKWAYAAKQVHSPLSPEHQSYPVAEFRNAGANEIYFENFEASTVLPMGTSHTGSYCFEGDFAVPFTPPSGKSYLVRYYYRDSNGDWRLVQVPYTGPTTLTDGDAIDDVAVFPVDASVSTMAYLDDGNQSSVTDVKGYTNFYAYDEMGRLFSISDDQHQIIKQYQYNYGSAKGPFYNGDLSAVFTKNDCSSGVGSRVVYAVPANRYYSTISQEAADAQAQAEINANGQGYANTNGACLSGTTITYDNQTESPYLGEVTQLQVKDLSGNVLYTFSTQQLSQGVLIPQGTYHLVLNIAKTSSGWGSCLVYVGNAYYDVYNDGINTVYTLSNINLNQSSTNIVLSSGIL